MTSSAKSDPESPYVAAHHTTATPSSRRGHKFLCVFGDMRVATVAVNVLNIVVLVFGGIIELIMYPQEDIIQERVSVVLLSVIGIFGALRFEFWAIAVATVGFVFSLLYDMQPPHPNMFHVALGVLILYPHTVLAYELYYGVLTQESCPPKENSGEDRVLAERLPQMG